MVFSVYSCFIHQLNWPPRYNWNIVESCVKPHLPKIQVILLNYKIYVPFIYNNHLICRVNSKGIVMANTCNIYLNTNSKIWNYSILFVYLLTSRNKLIIPVIEKLRLSNISKQWMRCCSIWFFLFKMQSLIVSRDHLHQYLFSLTIVSVSSKSDETVQCMFSINQAYRQ